MLWLALAAAVAGLTAFIILRRHSVSVHVGGRGPGNLVRVPLNPTGLGGNGMATPTLTNSSALGAAPLVLSWSDTNYVVGLYGQLQIASDSGFSTITQNIVFFIDGTSWANLDESIGLVTPSGTYYARIRVCQDDNAGPTTVTGNDPSGNAVSFTADVSPWSNTFTDTINVTSTVWNTTTGTNKNSNLTVSGTPALVCTGPSGFNGLPSGTRATQAVTGKRHFEITITNMVVSSNPCYMGIEGGTNALGPTVYPNPPSDFTGYRSDGVTYKNGSVVTGVASCTTGDVIIFEFDTSAATMTIYKNNGSTVLGTISGITVSNWYAYNALEDANTFTANFGQNAFVMTPNTGYLKFP